jgi:hypothetical protein
MNKNKISPACSYPELNYHMLADGRTDKRKKFGVSAAKMLSAVDCPLT